jgi:DNA helicase-2/ATP-dependent DNA helicase PcrA
LVGAYTRLYGLSTVAARALRERLKEWKGEAEDESAPANLVRDYYVLLRLLGVHKWDLSDPNAAARMGSLARFSQLLADFEHARRRSRRVDEGGGQT